MAKKRRLLHYSPLLYKPDAIGRQKPSTCCTLSAFVSVSSIGRPLPFSSRPSSRGRSRETSTTDTMARFIVASLILVLAFAAAVVDGRMPRSRSGVRELIGVDACQKTCEQVHFRTMCDSLTKLPQVTTPRELLLASMRVAAEKAKEAKSRVDAYAATWHGGRPMDSILQSCSGGYDSMVQNLADLQQRIPAQGAHFDFDLNNAVSGVLTSASDCDNAFQDFPDVESPFAAVQRNVYRLADNVLNIAVVVLQAEEHAH
ncbi:hypothetical protein U9M48_044740 [Paspalum notatum var. saurae]|uniref:Pectinesterase inhibitor domain-containing protein n=1 Tax=Paspalum notatum var. saurae TaxID=547442 RepID=A0AAQ3V1S1_PASNO